MSGIEQIGRMLLALGVVLGVMWALARFARRPIAAKADRVMAVLARQQLNRNASIAVVKVMDKALIVGFTDAGVQLLSEADLDQVTEALTPPAREARPVKSIRPPKSVRPPKSIRPGRSIRAGQPAAAERAAIEAPVLERSAVQSATGEGSVVESPVIAPGSTKPVRIENSFWNIPADADLDDDERAELELDRRSPLDGSILSPKTWKQLLDGARELTVRR